ncbi:hypothetical protein AVEN_175010-1 [Araneus ventricosus]|uniref:Uncharacterized protein n=2 Tax=Araneus ventricosus TaxID=182803 RepID=A0A4Y2BKH9_ARAVE|nr:hypothetical protein AVEN_175010-1 [Araneus ventricosus]
MRHELNSPNLSGHLPHALLYPSLKAHENGLWWTRIIGPSTAFISLAISEPYLPSEEANRLRLAFVAVKRKFLDRPGPPRSFVIIYVCYVETAYIEHWRYIFGGGDWAPKFALPIVPYRS